MGFLCIGVCITHAAFYINFLYILSLFRTHVAHYTIEKIMRDILWSGVSDVDWDDLVNREMEFVESLKRVLVVLVVET